MEREELIKEIRTLAEKVKSNAADTDSLLADAAHLYELAILLKHLDRIESQENVKSVTETAAEVKVHAETVKITEEKISGTPDLFSSAVIETDSIAHKTIVKENSNSIQPKKSEPGSVADKLKSKKVDDLKSVIGINEKFQFINELFDGNMQEYNAAVERLNRFSNHGEAENELAALKETYKWNADNPVAESFEELVKRRFHP